MLSALVAAAACVDPSLDAAVALGSEPAMDVSLSVLPAASAGLTLRSSGPGRCGMGDGVGWEVRFAGRDSATSADLVLHLGGVGPAAQGQLAALWLSTGSRTIDGRVTVIHSTSDGTLRMVLAGTAQDGTRLSGMVLCRPGDQPGAAGDGRPASGSINPKEKV
jgi:hypothetical protein